MEQNNSIKSAFADVNHMNANGLNLFIIDDDPLNGYSSLAITSSLNSEIY